MDKEITIAELRESGLTLAVQKAFDREFWTEVIEAWEPKDETECISDS